MSRWRAYRRASGPVNQDDPPVYGSIWISNKLGLPKDQENLAVAAQNLESLVLVRVSDVLDVILLASSLWALLSVEQANRQR
jgi:hypothetical protein